MSAEWRIEELRRIHVVVIDDDLDAGVVGKGALDVLVERLPVPRDDQELLDGRRACVLVGLRALRPAPRERLELGQRLKRSLVQEPGQEDRGTSAAPGA